MTKQACCLFPEKLFESFANHELLNKYFKRFKKSRFASFINDVDIHDIQGIMFYSIVK